MRKDRNGIPILDDAYLSEMKKGRNASQRPPLAIQTRNPFERKQGASLAKLRQIWPSVNWISTLG